MSQRSTVARDPRTITVPLPPADDLVAAAENPMDGIDPRDFAAAIELVKRQREHEEAAVAAALRRAETGYPKVLYNPRYPREIVRQEIEPPHPDDPNGRGKVRVYQFTAGSITVDTPEQEDFLRAACPTRIYEADTEKTLRCKTCGFTSRSYEANSACLESHR